MAGTNAPSLADPVDGDFVDPFDRLALKGQSVRPVLPPKFVPREISLVELADEFSLTTAQALDVCDRANVRAAGGGSMLTDDDAALFRSAATQPTIIEDDQGNAPLSLRARLDGLTYEGRVARKKPTGPR